ncbi:MAG TPA: alpha/beta hydrolase [Vicinamibacterales bacterium]|jgi:pimeloyl-ACP methyl ester carboxylesterase|nr:alpha/beta hydrolase [Vicinamibacterales bacterium]
MRSSGSGAIHDVGAGPAIVLIPGIQGRWEWMRPAIGALATRWRVITCSLPGEPGVELLPEGNGNFESYVRHVDRLLDSANLSDAVICGVSFGGLIALRYAARRRERVRALILVSTPGPRWRPTPRQARHMRWPILNSPLFVLGAVKRGWSELRVTLPYLGERLAFCARLAIQVASAPGIPSRMSARARLAVEEHFENDCARVAAPTLVIAGERDLDKVVRFDDTMCYVASIPGAEFQLFEQTGHLGTASAPDRFAAIVSKFLSRLPDRTWPTTSAS